MRRYGTQGGFTIVEIMSVIAIIGILAVLVLPSIRVNAVRTKMAEVILAFGPCKAMVTEILLSGDEIPPAGQWGCEVGPNATTYVDSVTTSVDGIISISLHGFKDGRLDNRTVTLAPLDYSGNVGGGQVARWRCGSVIDATDVAIQYLPASCRG